jgi:hypothetical protein
MERIVLDERVIAGGRRVDVGVRSWHRLLGFDGVSRRARWTGLN